LVTKVKPNTPSFEVHPQLSNNGHPVDGVLVGGSLCHLQTNPDVLIFYPSPHLPIQTHPGLVINQVQEGARKLYRVKWPCYHYLLHQVLPHGLWPYKQRKQRKGILQLPTWRSVPPPCDRHLQLFTQKVNDVSRNCAISKFEE